MVSVRDVRIGGTKSHAGQAAGAAMGGAAGQMAGDGRVRWLAATAGAVAGGIVGGAVEEAATRQGGVELTIRLNDGKLIAITQAKDEEFAPGDRVRLIHGSQATRVTHVR